MALGVAGVLGPFLALRFMLAQVGIRLPNLLGLLWSLGKNILPLLAGGLRFAGQALLFVGRALLTTPVGMVVAALALAALAIVKYWEPVKAFFSGLWQGFTEGLKPLQPLLDAIGKALAPLAPIWDAVAAGLGAAWNWISRLFEPLQSTSAELETATNRGRVFGQWLADLVNLIAGLPNKFVAMGGMLIDGLVTGITSRLTAAKDAIMGIGDSVVKWFREKLDIHSPSRVFATLGNFVMQGLAVGLAKGEDGPLGQIASTAKQLASAGAVALGISTAATPALANGITFDDRPAMSAAAPAAQAGGDVYHITINAGPGLDAQAIAREVQAALARLESQKAARSRSSLRDQD